jgi:hypothetical protein
MPGLLMLLLTLGLPPASLFGLLWMARFEDGLGKEPHAPRSKRVRATRPSAAASARAVSPRYQVPASPRIS